MNAPTSIHIALFGNVNSGKSTLANIIFSHDVSLVSSQPGTTTDVVKKAIEISPIGKCVLLDTPGIGDYSPLGEKRLEKTLLALDETDVAFFVISSLPLTAVENDFIQKIVHNKVPLGFIFNKKGEEDFNTDDKKAISSKYKAPFIDANLNSFVDEFKKCILSLLKDYPDDKHIVSHLVKKGDIVLLVMPQDEGAPKNRLILPQQQVLRELLDLKCIPICASPEEIDAAILSLKTPPSLAITDSKVFDIVYNKLESICPITSFSVLFAYYKGDGDYALSSAKKLSLLNSKSKILIAECCSHAPINEDIGRVVIPRMLKKFISPCVKIDFVFGSDFPKNLKDYDIVIQCGGCMFTRKHILSRTKYCKDAGVPMTNYGMAIAYMNGILGKIKL